MWWYTNRAMHTVPTWNAIMPYYSPAHAAESNLNYYFAGPIPLNNSQTCENYILHRVALYRPYVPNNQCQMRLYTNVDLSLNTKARDNSTTSVIKQACDNKTNSKYIVIIVNNLKNSNELNTLPENINTFSRIKSVIIF